MEILMLLFLAMGPGVAIACLIYFADKWDREPLDLVLTCFLCGAFAIVPAGIIEKLIETIFGIEGITHSPGNFSIFTIGLYMVFGVGLTEETLKFVCLQQIAYPRKEFNEPFDGIVYGVMVGCGFATLENIFYVVPDSLETGWLRMFTAVPLHASAGVIMGYYVGKARFSPDPNPLFVKGLIWVIILHGIYDTGALSENTAGVLTMMVGVLVFAVIFAIKAKNEFQKHSEMLDSSFDAFYLIRDRSKKGPYILKEIRDFLGRGEVKMQDMLIPLKRRIPISVKDVLHPDYIEHIGKPAKDLPRDQSLFHFLVFYTVTFGIYIYFWFYCVYRDFKNHKNSKMNPGLLTLGFALFTLVPPLIFGFLQGNPDFQFLKTFETEFFLVLGLIQASFLFFLLRMVKGFLGGRLKKIFSLYLVVILFLATDLTESFLRNDVSYYWGLMIALVVLQGGILAWVQKNLNEYWAMERSVSSPSPAESFS